MKKFFTATLAIVGAFVFGQFSTPNTGQTYTIEDLDALTEAISYDTTTNKYILTEDLTISEADSFVANTNFVLAIEDGKLITINGSILVNAPDVVHFTSTNPGTIYFNGLRIADGAAASFTNFKMTYGGGIRVLGDTFFMNNSEISFQNSGISTGGAINFSRGNPTIQNSRFEQNVTPAVGSGANQSVALTFINNYLSHNNLSNSNRPQINMGPSGNGGVTRITGNTIIGDRTMTRVGGVSVSSLLGVNNEFLIEDNLIKDNRYGITASGGNTKGNILNNQIIDNNTEPIPANGGSGINIYLAQNPADYSINIFGNEIKGNLWGITNIGNGAYINLGDEVNRGNNVFENNGNEGVTYALYNNSVNSVSAKGNCWDPILTDTRVEEVIVHYNDDTTLGLVDYSDYGCLLNTTDVEAKKVKVYPNPNNGNFIIETKTKDSYRVFDLTGKLVNSGELLIGKNEVKTNLTKGVYVVKTKTSTFKMIVK